MGTLYIAANYIGSLEPLQDYGHLQIVYNDGTGFREIEVQAPYSTEFSSSIPNFAFPPEQSHGGGNTDFIGNSDRYKIVPIDTADLQGRSADDVWGLLTKIHNYFLSESPNFFYELNQNSNGQG